MNLGTPGPLGTLVLAYLDRAVHRHDLTVVDELVSPSYAGHGFAPDRDALRVFYAWQARTAPDWRIDVEDLVEEGTRVAVRAHAYGTRTESAPGVPLPEPEYRDLEWLAIYRFAEGLIEEIWVAVRDR
ncbi:MAG TPA: ester cyclase [Frankiaceae bacterium]|nr:ester cyclase [Frankiaceae bacterium]